jgi:hypothetical protein
MPRWFPAALSVTGIRFSVILHPPGSWALLAVGLPNHGFGPRRGFHVPHIRAATGLGALCAPGTTVLTPDRGHFPAGRLPLRNGQSLHPAALPIDKDLA